MGFQFGSLKGVTSSAYIQRACLDATTGILTVFFTSTSDACGSFKEHILYGREDVTLPFVYLGKTTNNAGPSISVGLPNKKQWQVYIVTRYACNLTDTFSSNYVLIDNTPPSLLNIDSVSIDISSQQVVVGWSSAPEPDVMGYSIFKVDPGSGNNILLKDTSTLFYKFQTSTFNSSNTGNRVAIAVFDSCTNGGVICNYHSPVLASYSMANNSNYRCTKKFTFSWTPYVGWTADRYGIWVEANLSGNWIYLGDVKSTSYIFDIPQLDNIYKFFVRAFKNPGLGGVTSTSNIISVGLPGYPKPTQNNIGHVSVLNNNTIEITGSWTSLTPGYNAELQFSEDGLIWNKLQATPATFVVNQTGLLVSKKQYFYRQIVFNPCGDPIDTSIVHASILLTRLGKLLEWSPYKPWIGNHDYNLLKKTNNQLFWLKQFSGTSNNYLLSDTAMGVCYRIKATQNSNRDSAFSNIICLFIKDTTLIPNVFNPEGKNPRFQMVNPNIENGQATMFIYDRWGGKIWEGDALYGWDGISNGNTIPSGLYVYKISIRRPIKNELFSGTVLLIR